MKQQIELSAELRSGTGKGFVRKLREKGRIPAVIYGGQGGSIALSVDQDDFQQVLKAGFNVLINVNINGDKAGTRLAMLKEIQGHPLKRVIFHIDFFEITEQSTVEVALPIHLKGEAIGVKRDKGILEQSMRKLQIECLANAIPEYIEVDISEVRLGSAIHVKDLVLSDGVKAKGDSARTVVSVVAPKGEKEEETSEEEVTEEQEQ